MPAKRISRVFTISLPPEMASKAEAMAARESRSMSELFREAFRAYHAQETRRWIEGIAEYAKSLPPSGYTEEDIPRLIKEDRAEQRAKKEALERKREPQRRSA